jgi:Tfp pilus assembly protein PilO
MNRKSYSRVPEYIQHELLLPRQNIFVLVLQDVEQINMQKKLNRNEKMLDKKYQKGFNINQPVGFNPVGRFKEMTKVKIYQAVSFMLDL